ncbi:MAG TPA: hypothetical protein VHN79_09075 [Lacunisphaera sp.]|nr:hypothetical protein [Lacunisphaera sp.]
MTRRERLLAETLAPPEGEAFARQAAAHARRRQLVKRTGIVAGVAGALAAVLVALPRPTASPPTPVTAAPAQAPVLEVMTDGELLALLQDQPVLILRDPKGITGVVFLPPTVPASL